MPDKAAPRLIRDKPFAKRLSDACDQYPLVPAYNFGRLAWVKDHLRTEHNVSVSIETVRKWFAGEARPRPDKMQKLAALLYVDEGWLSLGITPEMEPNARQAYNASAPGIINLVAGLIQLSGGHPAFPEEGDPRQKNANLCAIIKGKAYHFYVTLGVPADSNKEIKFTIPAEFENTTCIGAVRTSPLSYDFVQMTPDLLDKHGDKRGSYASVLVESASGKYVTGKDVWPRIHSFEDRL